MNTPRIPMDPIQKENPTSFVPERIIGRLFWAYCVIIAPLAGFAFSYDGTVLGPEWQSGKLSAYPEILLSGDIHLYFYPFIAFSIINISEQWKRQPMIIAS